ncbi:MAG: ABC transporter ATP-binding protein [Acidobacteriales bacterium]|nr:ABC transporter ATP-binding protein [Terriglobales bacterium]
MDAIVFESVSKIFRHRPAMFNWMGQERAGDTWALSDFSLRVPSGQVLVLLGPNGSGKTTALKLISTVLLPDAGRVEVLGADTVAGAGTVRKQVGFAVATERSFFPRLSARENLDFFAALDDVPRRLRANYITNMLERVGLSQAADTLVMKFSSGMYQRLGIARALIKQPAVILLDEPTRSLDPGSSTQFWQLVRELADCGATVLLATHNFSEAVAVGDTVGVLRAGKLEGFQDIRRSRVDELRDFYFEMTGEYRQITDPATAGRQ